jgi:hypothetical protein
MLMSDRQYEAMVQVMLTHRLSSRSDSCSCGEYIYPVGAIDPLQAEQVQYERFIQHVARKVRIAVDQAYGPPINKSHDPVQVRTIRNVDLPELSPDRSLYAVGRLPEYTPERGADEPSVRGDDDRDRGDADPGPDRGPAG